MKTSAPISETQKPESGKAAEHWWAKHMAMLCALAQKGGVSSFRAYRHGHKWRFEVAPVTDDTGPLETSDVGPLAPSLTPESAGWWWLQVKGEWCACTVKFKPASALHRTPSLSLTWLFPRGSASTHYLQNEEEIRAEVWGGRILGPVQP